METRHEERRNKTPFKLCANSWSGTCIRREPGVWEVQCARCVGECMLCDCHLAGYCLGKGKTPVKTHMYVVKPEKKD